MIQSAIGKLYVLSLFYMLCVFESIPAVLTASDVTSSKLGGSPRPVEQPTAFISTLTVPTEVLNAFTFDAPAEDVTHSEIAAGYGTSRTVGFTV